ncbi:hypothetical protein [Polaromonas sp.]|uniref:hypothetical protein n=1 Tax=Polaromonas sp. TaxID=1869339 RepID=UPI003CA25664
MDLRLFIFSGEHGFRRAGQAVLLFAGLALGGCQTVRNGGAPEPSFDINTDLKQLSEQYQNASSIANYYKAPGRDARDDFVTGRLVSMDLRYIQFIRGLTSEKQQIDSATDAATMTLNLLGTIVGSARAKTNLAATAAGVGGLKTNVDKHFYFEKSIEALVATMNAQRKEVLVRIIGGLQQDIDAYPFTQAVTDLHDYYAAGTLNGAIISIQQQAVQKEDDANEKIQMVRDVALLTPAARTTKRQLTAALAQPGATPEALAKALATLGMDAEKIPKDARLARRAMQNYIVNARDPAAIDAVQKAMKAANIL